MGTSRKSSNNGTDSPVKDNEDSLIYMRVENLTKNELEKSGKLKVLVNDEEIALMSHKNKLYAVQKRCPHLGGPLERGDIEDLPEYGGACIKCPLHSWKFNLTTGKCVFPSNRDAVAKIYPIRLDPTGQLISIGFEKLSTSCFNTIPP